MFSIPKYSFLLDNENQRNCSTFCSGKTSFRDPSGMYLTPGQKQWNGFAIPSCPKTLAEGSSPQPGQWWGSQEVLETRVRPDMLKQYCVSPYLRRALDEYVLRPTQNRGNSPRDGFFCDCSKIPFKRVQGSHPTSASFLFHQH